MTIPASTDITELETTLHVAVEIAKQAGERIRQAFPVTRLDPASVNFKGAVDPVTKMDTAAEALIVERLRAAFPHHHILAEESGGDDWTATAVPIWLIDPLDGTNNFAHGFPHVAVSLALVWDGRPVVAVTYDPLRDETFAAVHQGGATRNGEPIRVTSASRLEDAFLATGFPYDRRTADDNNTARLDRFLRRSQGVRRAGAAVLDLAYVACGRLDGFWEIRLKPWDVAAGILLVREAGGQVTDFAGREGLSLLSGQTIVASNRHIHEQMLSLVLLSDK